MNAFSSRLSRAFQLVAIAATGLAFLSGCGAASSDDSNVSGKQVFQDDGCAGCHVLTAADAEGPVGPALDGLNLSAQEVAQRVRDGGGSMPAFRGRLSEGKIRAVSEFVAESSR